MRFSLHEGTLEMVSELRQKKLSHKLSMKVTASKCVLTLESASKCVLTLESREMCLVSLGNFSVDHIAFQRPAGKQITHV